MFSCLGILSASSWGQLCQSLLHCSVLIWIRGPLASEAQQFSEVSHHRPGIPFAFVLWWITWFLDLFLCFSYLAVLCPLVAPWEGGKGWRFLRPCVWPFSLWNSMMMCCGGALVFILIRWKNMWLLVWKLIPSVLGNFLESFLCFFSTLFSSPWNSSLADVGLVLQFYFLSFSISCFGFALC